MIGKTTSRRFPVLATVAAACLAAAVATAAAAEPAATPMQIKEDGTTVTISASGQPVLVYRFGGVPRKPYVKEFSTPAGVQVLRDSPADHKHHHALMYAVGIDGVDFWSENESCGRQVHRGIEGTKWEARGDTARAGFTEKVDWVGPKAEKPLATERRTIRVVRLPGEPVSLVTWETRLEPAAGRESIKLGGSHYFGLGMRFVESMDREGKFFTSEGKEGTVVRGQERLTPARWCAYTAPAGGKTVTAAMFDDPKNARHPALFFTMPAHFAYISATLNLWKEPLEVKAGQPLVLRYGVALWDGEVKPEEVEKVYRSWSQSLTGG